MQPGVIGERKKRRALLRPHESFVTTCLFQLAVNYFPAAWQLDNAVLLSVRPQDCVKSPAGLDSSVIILRWEICLILVPVILTGPSPDEQSCFVKLRHIIVRGKISCSIVPYHSLRWACHWYLRSSLMR